MKTEKVNQDRVSHTIQQMHSGNGTMQQIDNRLSAIQQAKITQVIQCQMNDEEEEPSQLKADVSQRKANNTGLPDGLKNGIENLSGYSMDDVHVHYNSDKPASVQAHAYTQGTDIHIAPGQEQHLPHEAWHVVQQMQDRVSPTTEIGGMPVNDNASLESEADMMGAKAF